MASAPSRQKKWKLRRGFHFRPKEKNKGYTVFTVTHVSPKIGGDVEHEKLSETAPRGFCSANEVKVSLLRTS